MPLAKPAKCYLTVHEAPSWCWREQCLADTHAIGLRLGAPLSGWDSATRALCAQHYKFGNDDILWACYTWSSGPAIRGTLPSGSELYLSPPACPPACPPLHATNPTPPKV